MSEPLDAAVADAFGTLLVSAAVDADLINTDAELVGDNLRHLDVQALPHFGAAMIKLHGAVFVNMHERTGLVQVRGRKRDTELHRRVIAIPRRSILDS